MLVMFAHLSIINPKYYIIISIFMGSVLGFFILNFPPAKLFLGDAGSQLFGWVSAISIIYLSLQFNNNALKVFLLSFISLPFYDVFFVSFRRFYSCKDLSVIKRCISIVQPDKRHIHHLFLIYGFSFKHSLLLLLLFYFINLAICILSFFTIGAYIFTFMFILILNIALRIFFEFKINNKC